LKKDELKRSEQSGNAWSDGRSSAKRHVEVHIEELVLHGFAPSDRRQIADAVQVELVKLMEQGRLTESKQNSLAFRQIDAGAFQIKHDSKAASSGTQIAQAVFRGLRRQMRASVYAPADRPRAGGRKP
jgi:hypothetical protein